MQKILLLSVALSMFALGFSVGFVTLLHNAEIFPYGDNSVVLSIFGEEHIYEWE